MPKYKSVAHEIMAESGLNQLIRKRVKDEDTATEIITAVRNVIDSGENTSDGWRRLYEETRQKLALLKKQKDDH